MRTSLLGRPTRSRRAANKNQKRRHLAEKLESRMLLAGDVGSVDPSENPATVLASTLAAEGEEVGSFGELDSFGQSLRTAVDEISRVVDAIGSSAELAQEIPYLGSLLPVSVGGTAVIDTASIGALFGLAQRFEADVAGPLRTFLDSVPNASPSQLIAEFDFLDAVPGLAGGVEGVKLNLDLAQPFDSSVAALLEPITARIGGLIDAVDADALATELSIDLSLDGFSLEILKDANDQIAISIPDFSLNVSRIDLPPIDFAAEVGFLSGGVVGGEIEFDFEFQIDFGTLFRDAGLDTTSLAGMISLDLLSEIGGVEISDALEIQIGGDGLTVDLPFDFDLAGFDTGGFLPIFTLSDANPLDGIFPEFGLSVPVGAPYSADALLGFNSIDATDMLASLEQLGAILGLWEQGSLLNFPVPFGDDVTLGDAIGLAESYGGAVLQFLSDGNGLPTFDSIQELGQLIPGLVSDATGSAITYDPTTQILNLSLDVFRQPDPIVTQANLNLFAGNDSSPIATVQAAPGVDGIDNRLTITRNASLGLDLQVDLSTDSIRPDSRVDLAALRRPDVRGWTPMATILRRLGLGHLTDIPQTLELRLRSGSVVSIDMGTADEFTSLDEWLARGTTGISTPLVQFEFEPFGADLNEDRDIFDPSVNRFAIRDRTVGSQPTEVLSTDEFWTRLLKGFSPDSNEPTLVYSEILNSPTDLHDSSTPLEKFFPTFAIGLQDDNDPLEISFLDGSSRIIDFGPIFGQTIGDLMDALTIVDGGQTILEPQRQGDRIILRDFTIPVPGGEFLIDWADDGGDRSIELFVRPARAIAGTNRIEMTSSLPPLPYDGAAPIDRGTTLGSILNGTPHEELIGTTSTAMVILNDGSVQAISTGPLEATMTLGELAASLFVNDGTDILLASRVQGDRLLLFDQTGGTGEFSITDTTAGKGFFQTFFVDYLEGRPQRPIQTGITIALQSDSLSNLPGSQLRPVATPSIFVDATESISLWTKVSTILERNLDGDQATQRQEAEVTLRDGTLINLVVRNPNSTTIGDLLKQGNWYRGAGATSDLIAELNWDGDRLSLVDYTTPDGTSELEMNLASINGSFWPLAVGFVATTTEGDVMTGRELRSTILNTSAAVQTPLSFLLPADSPYLGQLGSGMTLRLPNGILQSIFFSEPANTTLEAILERLTVRRDGVLLTESRVVNDRIEVEYVGPDGDGPLSLEWDLINNFGVWPSQFLPIGQAAANTIVGQPFYRSLPGSESAPIDGQTRVADTFRNKLWLADIDGAVEQTASGRLRDGTDFTINMGVIDQEITWDQILDRLRVQDGDSNIILNVVLEDDRIVLIDTTDPEDESSFFFMQSDSGSFFQNPNFVETLTDAFSIDRNDDGRLVSRSLATHDIVSDTTLRQIFGDTSPIYNAANADVDVFANVSKPSFVAAFDFPNLTPEMTLGQLLDQTNADIADGLVSLRLRDGRIILSDLSTIDTASPSLLPQQLKVDTIGSPFGELLLDDLKDFDYNGEVVSRPLWKAVADSRIDPSSSIGDYFRSVGLGDAIDQAVTSPIKVNLLDGTVETFEVSISDSTTLSELARQFRIERDGVVIMQGELERVDSPYGPANYRFVLVDQTEPINDESAFVVAIDQSQNPSTEARLPSLIGLTGTDQNASGLIVGPRLRTDSVAARSRIKLTEPPRLRAEIVATASDVNAEIRIGELLSGRIRDGNGQASAVIDISLMPPAGRDFLTLEELLGSTAKLGEFLEITVDASIEFGGEVYADFAGLNSQPTDPSEIPRIDFAWPSAITNDPNLRFQTDTLTFTQQNLGGLLRFEGLTVQHITNLIRKVVDLVERISGDELLNQQLPLVNTSLAQVLDTVDYVSDLVDQVVNDPNATLDTLEQDLESMLGLAPNELTLTYLTDENQIRIDFDLDIDAVNTNASLNLDLSDVGLSQLDGLVDLEANANIGVTAGANLAVSLGLDLDELASVNFDDAVVIYDNSTVTANVNVRADNLAFSTSVLALGIEAGPGTVVLDRDGLVFGGGPQQNEDAIVTVRPTGSWPGGFKTLSDLTAADFELDSEAEVGVDLPVTFLGDTQDLQIKWNDLTSFSFDLLDSGQSIDDNGGNQIIVPDLAAAASNVDFADAILALATGLQGLFDAIDGYLGDEVLGVPVPLIGDALDDMVDFVDNFRGRLSDGLSAEGVVAETAAIVIFDTLGPGPNGTGLNILDDLNGDGSITIDDVEFNIGDNEASYRLRIGRSDLTASANIDLGVGGSALGLDLQGDVSATLGYSFDVGFGISTDQGPFVEFFEGDDISLDFFASIDDLIAEGRLGPLSLTAQTIDASELSANQRAATRLDPSDPSSETINGIRGAYQIDFGSGRYTLANIGSLFSNVQTEAALVGSLFTRINTGVAGISAGLPSLSADLLLNFERSEGSIADVIEMISRPTVSITNAGLDLGSFVTDVLKPILEPVNDFLDPIRPVLEQLTSPIPVLSDLIGPTTYVDLISLFGEGGESVSRFVTSVAEIVRLLDIPITSDSLILPLGNFDTTFNTTTGFFEPIPSSGSADFQQFVAGLGPEFAEIRDYLQDIPQEEPQFDSSGELVTTPGKFSIPLLQNPASAIGLLFGQNVDLLKYQAPKLDASFSFRVGIPVFPAFNITFGGTFGAEIDFAFGYDTNGIFKYAESRRAIDLLDGFFFDDRAVFDSGGSKVSDVPELTFRFGVTAGGEIDLKAAKAGVEVGINAALLLDLNDPNLDGKIRFSELLENLQLGNAPGLGPLWVFDASGQIEAYLSAYAKAFGIRVQATLGPKVLVNYDFPRPEPANPVLGRVLSDGTLVVHVGPDAALRVDGNTDDGDETVFISTDEDTGETIINGFGTEQRFSGVTSLFVDSGAGDDYIGIDASFAFPVTVYGRGGDDEITGGSGPLTAYGGGGNDVVYGGSGNDTIYGNGTDVVGLVTINVVGVGDVEVFISDDDIIDGGDGNDRIFGNEGVDLLQGGRGDDRIDGGDGDDYVGGGDGNDSLFGGDGDDVVSGDKGDDLLVGESEDGSGLGQDFLQGGPGSDRLEGGPGNDELFGGSGGDQLLGGAGDDLLVGAVTTRDNPDFEALQPTLDTAVHFFDGGAGNDLIYGTAGIDTVNDLFGLNIVWTYESADVINTGDGNDIVRTGPGDDVINVGGGNNEVYAGGGFDIVTAGPGSDLIDLRPTPGGSANLIVGADSFGSQVTDTGGNNRILGDRGDDIITVTGFGNNFVDVGEGTNIVRTSVGSDTIRSGGGDDVIEAGDGNNDVSSGAGDDAVTTGVGNDRVRLGSGDDVATTGAGNDVVTGGRGNDSIDAGSGDDLVRGGDGDDELVGGIGSDTVRGDAGSDVIWGGLSFFSAASLLNDLVVPAEFSFETSTVAFPAIVPRLVEGSPIEGQIDDGDDLLRGGDGFDLIFGGGGEDDIDGGSGFGYLDGGQGNDIVRGGGDQDVIRGGGGDDDLRGGGQIDFLYGDAGEDELRGDAGAGSVLFGQKLFGGAGNDVLMAYAGSAGNEADLLGDYLDGGAGADDLFGNLRQEVIIGGPGDDRLEGDGLSGPNYGANPNPLTTGGGDLLVGGFGDDLLLGGGGDDEIWGGGNSDELEGHAGQDRLYGGNGIDFIRYDVNPLYAFGGDTIDGDFGNSPFDLIPTPDDGATDILVIPGTIGTATDDVITLGGSPDGKLVVNYNGAVLLANFRDADGNALIEQFQVDGFDGDDTIGFLSSLDLSDLADRSRDWVGVFNGGAGNDTLTGSTGRDRLDGGRGSDTIFGFGGDDRLWGDSGEGSSLDLDVLFAGAGNDDLLGGVGTNRLYAWSDDPGAVGIDFGRFVNPLTGQASPTAQPGFVLEDTGLNRMLGRDGDDLLFAGTGLDFMYGGEGTDILHGVDGIPIEFGIGVPEDEEWLEYARSTDKVWYYGGSGADDIITVNYVTEPGSLGGLHLITRLTENNGFFTFDAQVQLDFAATNPDGSLVWDPSDLVYRIEEAQSLEEDDERRLAEQTTQLSSGLLPPEGDYLAIIINAGDGDDQVFVGPTVQRSVWVAAGDGDDRVEFASGVALLVDLADTDRRNEVAGDGTDPANAYRLPDFDQTTLFTGLTIDNPRDVDWYEISLPDLRISDGGGITVDSVSPDDEITLEFYEMDDDRVFALIGVGQSSDDAAVDPEKGARVGMNLEGFTFDASPDFRYFIRVASGSEIPTQYDLGINLGEGVPLGLRTVSLGVESNTFLRRDVIVGGKGADVLRGGPSEDWVIGGAGNDVLSGGDDRGASDILIGEAGDDIFQIIPSDLGGAELLTLADELEGGPGYDRVLFLGGDVDQFGRSVNDSLSLRYNANLARYELAAKVWDTANQTFLTNEAGDKFLFERALYRTRGIEATEFNLRGGDDELHLEPQYNFLLPDGSIDLSLPPFDPDIDPDVDITQTYGIDVGDRQAGGLALSAITIFGGDGNDRIFGSPYADVIDAGAGFDLVLGYGGGDTIAGGSGTDLLLGGDQASNVPLLDRFETTTIGGQAASNDTSIGATWLDLSSEQVGGLTLSDGDQGDWYILPNPGSTPEPPDFGVMFGEPGSIQNKLFSLPYIEPTVNVFPAVLDPTGQYYVPTSGVADVYLLHVRNPLSSAIIADVAPQSVSNPTQVNLKIRLDGPFSLPKTLSITVAPSMSGKEIASRLQTQIDALQLDDRLFVAYDDQRDRLILQSLSDDDLIVQGEVNSNIRFLGFTDGQTNDGVVGPLGEYEIITGVSFPLIDNGGGLPAAAYQYELSPPGVDFVTPSPLIDLSLGQFDLNGALRIEGDTSQEELSEIIPIGDINGDGRNDVMLVGNDLAYVFLGDLQPSSRIVSAGDAADFVLDISDGFRPIPSVVDLDSDGLDDLSFWKQNASGAFVDIEILLGSDLIAAPSIFFSIQPGVRVLDASDMSRRLIGFGTDDVIEAIDFQWLNFNDDSTPDLMAISRTPIVQGPFSSVDLGYGYVYDGAFFAENLFGAPPAGESRLIFIGDRRESGALIGGLIDGGLGSAVPLSDELFANAGDFDGDGMDEIVLTKPNGWTFDSVTVGEPLVVSRTYLLDTDGASDLNVELGRSSTAPAILQHYEVQTNESFGALSTSTPLTVGDLDTDGTDDLIISREVEQGDLFKDALLIYRGQTLSTISLAADNSAGADKRIRGVADQFDRLRGVDISVGDFDGDHVLDLAIGQPNAGEGDSAVTVLYDALGGGTIRNVSDSIGDARADSVRILSVGVDNRLGVFPAASIDVTGDRITDLLVGASRLDTASGVRDGGGVFVIPGGPRVLGLPDESLVTEIANKSIRGFGDVVTDLVDVIENDSVILNVGDDSAWFRFTTVGDGAAGDFLRVGPTAVQDPILLIDGVAGNVPTSASVNSDTTKVLFGETDGIGVIEFDLTKLLSAYEDPSEIQDAKLLLAGSTTSTAAEVAPLLNPKYFTPTQPGGGFGERVFFEASMPGTGGGLWVSDGTREGTSLVFEPPGDVFNLTAIDHRVVFTSTVFGEEEGAPETTFYISDGVNTTEIKDPNNLAWEIDNFSLFAYDGSIYFINGVSDPQLYRASVASDGKVTVTQVTNISGGFRITGARSTDAGLFMTRETPSSLELWITRGTGGTTTRLKEFENPNHETLGDLYSLAYGGGLLFVADDNQGAGQELWFSDGTTGGTTLVSDIDPGLGSSGATGFVELNGTVRFFANGGELWETDGTPDRTKQAGVLFSSLYNSNVPYSLATSQLHVGVGRTAEGNVVLISTDASGQQVASTSITAGRFVIIDDVAVYGDQIMIGYNTQEAAFQEAPDRVAIWNPATGRFTELASETKNTHDFRSFVEVSGRVLFEGYKDDNTLNDQVWYSDGTVAKPLFDENDGGGTEPGGTVTVSIRGEAFDGEITGEEVLGNLVMTRQIQLGTNTDDFTIDLVEKESDLEQIRELFRLGYRSLVATFEISEGTGSIQAPNPSVGTGLEVARSGGVLASLLDSEGRLIANDFSGLDLRNLLAGTYYVGVSRAEQTSPDEPIPITITLDAPGQGDAHPLDDNDLIRGGDGDDVVVGGSGRDALWGDSGRDTFVSEFFEPRDTGPLEVIRDGLATETYADTPSERLQRDPIVLIGAGPIPEGAINIADANLATRIADALGVSIVTQSNDTFFAPPIYATDLAGLTQLDASNAGITSFAGLQYLTGLITLDLSDNGTLGNGALTRLVPAENGTEGMPRLRHLNLDGNRVSNTANLASLTDLRVLSVADQVGAPVGSLNGLDNLTKLIYVDVSGNAIDDVSRLATLPDLRVADIADNPIRLLGPLTGSYVVDDLSAAASDSADWTIASDSSAVQGSYQVASLRFNPNAAMQWTSIKLPAGTYEILATWFAGVSHTTTAIFSFGPKGNLSGSYLANQQLVPTGFLFGDKPFESLGTVTIDDPTQIAVMLQGGTDLGSLITDAIFVRPVVTSNQLARVDARRTQLDTDSRKLIVGDLNRRGVIVDVDANELPRWSGLPNAIAWKISEGFTLGDLDQFASDPEGTALTYSVTADVPGITLTNNGNLYKVNASSAPGRIVNLLLAATDASGLTAVHSISAAIDASIIEGRVTDTFATPIEGAVVFADDGSGLIKATTPTAVTTRDGTYQLFIPNNSDVTIAAEIPSDWITVASDQLRFTSADTVATDVDFVAQRAFSIDMPLSTAEGTGIVATLSSVVNNDGVTWEVAGGEAQIDDANPNKAIITPSDDGQYTITATVKSGGETYSITRNLVVTAVAPTVDAGDDVTIAEGRLKLDRTMIVDPGADSWNVLIDYGDGFVENLSNTTRRDVSLTHLYGDAGSYTVTITVNNEEGVATDSFRVEVVPHVSQVTLTASSQPAVKGESTELLFGVVDPTFQADSFVWQYIIDWDDGTTENFAPSVTFLDQDDRVIEGRPQHVYQTEGTYEVRLTVIDDDGDVQSELVKVVVGNDSPLVVLNSVDVVAEDELTTFEAVATDLDGIKKITWNFDDGTPVVEGATVTHLFADPGTYEINILTEDNQGEITSVSKTIIVTNVDDSPSLASVPILQINEGQTWTYTFAATDPDTDATFTFSLNEAPEGVSIDDAGVINWTPTLDQGPAQYRFGVTVTDDTGLLATTPVTIDVVDSGSISGTIFQDINGNGTFNIADAVLGGVMVRLDIGDDGIVDQTLQASPSGRYEFNSLPQGLYRVTATLPDGYQSTTPTSLLVNMETAQQIELNAIGGDDDSDGDGVSNESEINSPAGVDANADGTPDWLQSNVVSVVSPAAGAISLVGPIGSTITNVEFVTPPVDPPTGGEFPYGAIRFSVEGIATGGTAEVSLLLHDNPSISTIFKFGQTPDNLIDALFQAAGSSITGDLITVLLRDGQSTDIDGVTDGRVTEEFLLSNANLQWQNPINRFDTNNSTEISAIDALLIINRLRETQEPVLPAINDEVDRFYDVNGDGRISALDALQVVNELARMQNQSEGEEAARECNTDRVFASMSIDDDDKKEEDSEHYIEPPQVF